MEHSHFFKNLVTKIFNPQNKPNMKNVKFSAILGRDVQNGEVLSAEDLQKIEAALPNPSATETNEDASGANGAGASQEEKPEANQNAQNADLLAQISNSVATTVAKSLEPVSTQLSSLEQRIGKLEAKPGAEATGAPKVENNDDAPKNSWESPENSTVKLAHKLLSGN
jgi:hypothetical protein